MNTMVCVSLRGMLREHAPAVMLPPMPPSAVPRSCRIDRLVETTYINTGAKVFWDVLASRPLSLPAERCHKPRCKVDPFGTCPSPLWPPVEGWPKAAPRSWSLANGGVGMKRVQEFHSPQFETCAKRLAQV